LLQPILNIINILISVYSRSLFDIRERLWWRRENKCWYCVGV